MSEETEDYKKGYAKACEDMKAVQDEAYRRLFTGWFPGEIGIGKFLEDRPRLTRIATKEGEDIVKWIRPSELEGYEHE
jgi:hypothetical protein